MITFFNFIIMDPEKYRNIKSTQTLKYIILPYMCVCVCVCDNLLS